MVISKFNKKIDILACLNNRVIDFPDETFRSRCEWFNLEDLLRTLRSQKHGMEKLILRELVEELVVSEYVKKQDGYKQNKSQSKGEYHITEKGQLKLVDCQKMINEI